jgi:uncharacterized protein
MHRSLRSIQCVLAWLTLLTAQASAAADSRDTSEIVSAGNSPAETLSMYFRALSQRDKNPELGIYTPATQQMLKDWVMTAPQMENLVHTYSLCNAERARIDKRRRYAVIRYPTNQRKCSPWFFEYIDGGWALDLTMMQRAIRFGRNNAWHFERGAPHPYEFAFVDWEFDSHGFPRVD